MNLTGTLTRQTQIFVETTPVLKVIGLGGGGSNTINRMVEFGLSGVDYIAANTDSQALRSSLAPSQIQLGPELTRGLGAGGNPEIGEAAAIESYADLKESLKGADMVFLTAGMGGGTGTGSIAVAAQAAREVGAVTVSIVTMPFSFEVGKRQQNAQKGLIRLRSHSDTLITIPNDRLLKVAPKNMPLEMAFQMADDVLRQGIQGITELITTPGLINVDFSHIRNVFKAGGGSILTIGYGQGNGKVMQAVQGALHHPLLDTFDLNNATGIIANFTGGSDLSFLEVAEALTFLQEGTSNQAEIIPGVIQDDRMKDRVQLILVITGLGGMPIATFDTKIMTKAEPIFEKRELITNPHGEPVYNEKKVQIEDNRIGVGVSVGYNVSNDLDLPAFLRKRTK